MGDVRFSTLVDRIREAPDPALEIRRLSDADVIGAAVGAALGGDALLANVLATDVQNRVRGKSTILETATEGLLSVDKDGRVTEMNPAGERITGWSREEILGRVLHDACHAHDVAGDPVPLEACPIVEAIRGEVPVSGREILIARRGGKVTHVELSSAPIVRDGQVDGAVVTLTDVTGRRNAENEAGARARQQAAVADLGLAALRGLTLDALCDRAVRAIAAILDVELVKVLELLPGADSLLLRAGVGWREGLVGKATVSAGKSSQAGFTLLSDDPVVVEDLPTESRFSGPPLLQEHGVVSGVSAVIHASGSPFGVLGAHSRRRKTITRYDAHFVQAVANLIGGAVESERSDAALREARAELERRVEERTRALEDAYHDLESFNYTASHDLRAPLRGIEVYARALSEDHSDALAEEGRDLLQRLRRESVRASRLVGDLLALSRVGRVDLHRETVDATALAGEVAADLSAYDSVRAVDWSIEKGLRVHADPGLLRVVLENLLGNAWKFTSRVPRARIELGSKPLAEGLAFYVRDNGAGFDPSRTGELFQPFHRLHTSAEFEGTGVGLAIVRRVVERHGGRVWAEGRPGAGATIWFTLGSGSAARGRKPPVHGKAPVPTARSAAPARRSPGPSPAPPSPPGAAADPPAHAGAEHGEAGRTRPNGRS